MAYRMPILALRSKCARKNVPNAKANANAKDKFNAKHIVEDNGNISSAGRERACCTHKLVAEGYFV